jgi:uncharacterized membrane protein YccC
MTDQRDRIVFLVAVVAFAVWIGADLLPGDGPAADLAPLFGRVAGVVLVVTAAYLVFNVILSD